jgi:hypothetical protein
MSKILDEARSKMLEEIQALVQPLGEVKLNAMIPVEDPDIDTDYGSATVTVTHLQWDANNDTVLAIGEHIDSETGTTLSEAEPIDIDVLDAEEINNLLEEIQRSLQ